MIGRRSSVFVVAVLAWLASASASQAQTSDGALSSAERRAIAASGLPRAQIVSVKRDLVVAIRNRGATKGGVLHEGVQLQGEVVNADTARSLGYRSMRSTVNVDCARRRDMVVRMAIYPESNAKGEPIQRQVPGGWVQPSPNAYLADVIEALCSDVPRPALEGAPEAPPPRARPVARPITPAAAPPPEPFVPQPRAQTSDSEAIVTAVTARRPRLIPSGEPPVLRELTAPPAPTRPTPAVPPPPPRQKVEPANVRAAGSVAVQIAAVGSAAQAERALARLGTLPSPLGRRVQHAVVGGRDFHRAMVTGFASRADAKAFCEKVAANGGTCFVR